MRTFVRQLICIYLVTSLLASFPMGARGAVLCLEASGSISVEESAVCCTPASAYVNAPEASDAVGVPDTCGPCADIQLGHSDGGVVCSQGSASRVPSRPHTIDACGDFAMAFPSLRIFGPRSLTDPTSLRPQLRSAILRN